MAQKIWNYLMKKCESEEGIKKYLQAVFVNTGVFIVTFALVLVVASIVLR